MNFIKELPGTALTAVEGRQPWAATVIIIAVLSPLVVIAVIRWWRGQ